MAVAKPAPDFVATDVTTGRDVTLHRWRGRTLLMAFYHPRSATAFDMLRTLQTVQDDPSAGNLSVVAFLMSDDREQAEMLGKRLKLTLPQVTGMNLRASYAVETTPRFVIVDREGIVFSLSSGWGPETAATLAGEIERCAAGGR